MEEAVENGLASTFLNTYEVIHLNYPEFNPYKFKSYVFQNILALNYIS